MAEEQDKAEESQPAPTDDKPVTPAAPAPESQNTPPKVKTPSVKVRQPPGGKSSGPLWWCQPRLVILEPPGLESFLLILATIDADIAKLMCFYTLYVNKQAFSNKKDNTLILGVIFGSLFWMFGLELYVTQACVIFVCQPNMW